MKQQLFIIVLSAVLGITAFESFFPRKHEVVTIPQIVTHFDTVRVVPTWLNDSIKSWKKVKYITDTINLYHTVTRVDTEFVNVGGEDSTRENLYPVTDLHISYNRSKGSSGVVTTFSLRSGDVVASRFFVPGILTDVQSDSNSVPRLNFSPFPERGPTFLDKLKLVSIGFGACFIANKVH